MAEKPVISLVDTEFPPLPIPQHLRHPKPCTEENEVKSIPGYEWRGHSAKVKGKVTQVDARKVSIVDQQVTELENYSQRWNLCLYGVPENKEQDIRTEVIQICQAILPEDKAKLPDVIDTVHRLSQ